MCRKQPGCPLSFLERQRTTGLFSQYCTIYVVDLPHKVLLQLHRLNFALWGYLHIDSFMLEGCKLRTVQAPSVRTVDRTAGEINLALHKEASRTLVANRPDRAAARRPDHVHRAEVKEAHVRKAIIKAEHVRREAAAKAGHVLRTGRVEPAEVFPAPITIVVTVRTAVPETITTIV